VTEAAAAEELKVFKARKGPAEEVWEAELAAEPAKWKSQKIASRASGRAAPEGCRGD
jgi:hypothetical protein